MNIWEWIDYLVKGLQKVANQSQQNYQQVHAYIDGHDTEITKSLNDKVWDSIMLRSPNGKIWKLTIDDDGKLIAKPVSKTSDDSSVETGA